MGRTQFTSQRKNCYSFKAGISPRERQNYQFEPASDLGSLVKYMLKGGILKRKPSLMGRLQDYLVGLPSYESKWLAL